MFYWTGIYKLLLLSVAEQNWSDSTSKEELKEKNKIQRYLLLGWSSTALPKQTKSYFLNILFREDLLLMGTSFLF